MTSRVSSVQVALARRPAGTLDSSCFRVESVQIDDPAEGQVLVRNLVFSLDPYMRPRMDDERSYIAPFRVGHPLEGAAVAEVIKSRSAALPVGTVVLHMFGWREYAVLNERQARPVELGGFPPSYFLGALGMPGLTAFAGLNLAKLSAGDRIFISSAAGAVGGIVAQMARLLGASEVIGSAGGPKKVKFATDAFNFDRVIDYRDGDLSENLGTAAPGGFDVYFDNVGGDHFAAALTHLTDHGRVVVCGTISSYDDSQKTIPGNLFEIVRKRLVISGLYVNDHTRLAPEFDAKARAWITDGKLVVHESVTFGVESAPETFMSQLRGDYMGKVLVSMEQP